MKRIQKSVSRFLLTLLFLTLFSPLLQADDYRLQPGDVLEIKVTGKPELTTKQALTPDGSVSLPLVGRFVLQGKTLAETDMLLKESYAKYIQTPQVAVLLEKPTPPTPRNEKMIYVSVIDLAKNTVDVKKTESVSEALAFTAGQTFTLQRLLPDGKMGSFSGPTTNLLAGDILTIKIGREPSFWDDNWYKLLTGAGVVLGIYNSLKD